MSMLNSFGLVARVLQQLSKQGRRKYSSREAMCGIGEGNYASAKAGHHNSGSGPRLGGITAGKAENQTCAAFKHRPGVGRRNVPRVLCSLSCWMGKETALPLRPSTAQLADLTTLAKKHGGKFPAAEVVTELKSVYQAPHGSQEMPIWGESFSEVSPKGEAIGTLRITNIVKYIAQGEVKRNAPCLSLYPPSKEPFPRGFLSVGCIGLTTHVKSPTASLAVNQAIWFPLRWPRAGR